MVIDEIILKRFRNYVNEKITLKEGINIIIGDNAQGKTNIVEAIMMCCIGKSPRTSNDKQLINFNLNNADACYLKAIAKRNIGKTDVELYITKREPKRIKVNGMPVSKMGELIGNIKAIYFSPDDLKLIKETPEDRRRFLDIDISQINKSYFYSLSQYNKILKQRNNLLKNSNEKYITETIDIWNEQLSESGAKVIYERIKYIERLKEYVVKTHGFLTEGGEVLDITYQTVCDMSQKNQTEIKDILIKKLKESERKDIELKYTTVGSHRDDMKITANGIDIRLYGSQGQTRTAALSLKLAELFLFKDISGEFPVLLLDDVLSELDENRQRKLMEVAKNVQTLLTATYINKNVIDEKEVNVIKIKEGKVV